MQVRTAPIPAGFKRREAAKRAFGMAMILTGACFALRHYAAGEVALWMAVPLIATAAVIGWRRARLPIIPANLSWDNEVITITRPCGSRSFRWDEVVKVATWKDDLFSVDCICLGFAVDDDPATFNTIDDDMSGWFEFMGAANARFRLDPEWWSRVMAPAFGENFELLWRTEGFPPAGLCPTCTYDLRGLAPDTPCPECGATTHA